MLSHYSASRKQRKLSAYLGVARFATAASCAHGAPVILQQLLEKGYTVEHSFDKDRKGLTFKLTPKKSQALEADSADNVPPQVQSDWDAALQADMEDNVVNGGINPETSSTDLFHISSNGLNGAV